MDDMLVTVAEYANEADAYLGKALLDNAGIKSVVVGRNTASVYIGLSALGGYCKLLTFESDADRAAEILQIRKERENKKIKVICPFCGRSLKGATEEMIGDIGICPKCRGEFKIEREKA